MVDFKEHVLKPADEADAFIKETGSLPEIEQAAAGLRAAINQTRTEIEAAIFAERFPRVASDNFMDMAGDHLTLMTRIAIRDEGEAGYKREQLKLGLARIEDELDSLIGRFVMLRTDLAVSQEEF